MRAKNGVEKVFLDRKRSMTKNKRPINEFDVAKVLLSVLVVVGHVTRMYTPLGAVPP